MKNLAYIFILFLSQTLWSQSPEELFNLANSDFRNGKYQSSILQYEKIIKEGFQSAELYFNLGNANYKLNKIAPSIYYFEKALLIDPQNEDAKNNLAFAQRMTIDVIEPMPKTFFQKINESFIYPLSYNTWAWITVMGAFLSAFFFISYYFSDYTHKKRLFFVLSLMGFVFFLITLSIGIKARHHFVTEKPAIVFEAQVSVKSEPGKTNTEVFALHEGTKVQVIDQEENWVKIKLADGKIGWILKENIKLL
jgi:tetratricopeptide (TPR) repeat protein